MKELSVKEKAKRYDEALEEAKKWHKAFVVGHNYPATDIKVSYEWMFPELKESESEDEKIKKALIKYFTLSDDNADYQCCGVHCKDILAWLEKQGEQKPAEWHREDEQNLNTCLGYIPDEYLRRWLMDIIHVKYDKVEPKFHEGEWITNGDYTWKIVEVKPLDYILQSQDGNIVDDTISHVDEQFHSFTIEDAKDGDILFHSDSASNGIFIFKEINDREFAKEIICYCDYDSEDHFCLGEHHTCCWVNAKILHPATKEQSNVLFKKMKEAGYTFDFEKKELKKIEENTAWSEDDERMYIGLHNLIYVVHDCNCDSKEKLEFSDWLKSLKDRVQPKQKWSEEDEKYLKLAIDNFQMLGNSFLTAWLNSLKDRVQPQPKQEWSEEDDYNLQCMIAKVTSDIQKGNVGRNNEVIDWLKSLKDRVQPQPKQKWGEEDEKMCQETIGWFEKKCFPYALESENPARESINWLKSLKDRVQPQPKQEWSEEDENRINRLIAYFEDKESFTAEDDIVYSNWLKSLRPQNRWKPSDEQMNAFDAVLVYNPPCSNECRNHLITLYNELKKLREE